MTTTYKDIRYDSRLYIVTFEWDETTITLLSIQEEDHGENILPDIGEDERFDFIDLVHDEYDKRKIAEWKPLYEGEKQAGLLPANHYRD